MTPGQYFIPYNLAGTDYRMSVTSWGDPAQPPVVCVHGLARQSRDFDRLAQALADRFYVVCPDLPGRGQSGWLHDAALYAPPSYVVALTALLATLPRPVLWVGTSLGGICGMILAAQENTPISRMVLNDIGPFIPKASLARIRDYLGAQTVFGDLAEMTAHVSEIYSSFGPLTPEQWHHLTEFSARPAPLGGLTWHYDPKMIEPIKAATPEDIDLTPFWQQITCPMLTLRGAQSDLLLPATFAAMAEKSALHTVANCGHAPALMDGPSIAVIDRFLAAA
jgi:pimeloyl-ACP methyl ester carboxylesterase